MFSFWHEADSKARRSLVAASLGWMLDSFDVMLYARDSFQIVEHRYTQQDLREISTWWQEHMRKSVNELPAEPIERAFAKLGPVRARP